MILVDTSVWIDHLRIGNQALIELLNAGRVLAHPFITGELALGNLRQRDIVLESLQDLPQATIATDDEVLRFIDQNALFGVGIGYVDAHLLASTRLTPDALLLTFDKRLLAVSERLELTARLVP